MSEATKRRGSAAAWTLAGILFVGFLLRLRGIRSGLPVALNLDEYAHFTVSAVKMFGGGHNPNYFQNPPGYTYLLQAILSVAYLTPPVGSTGASIHHAFETDATTIYTIARVTSAAMGIGASLALYFAGRKLWGTGVALAAAAFLTFTFLPVHYSHFALNDVPTLLPLCIGLFGLSGVIVNGRALDYGIAGLGLGLATGTKYTAAALSVAIFVAWATHFYDDREQGKKEFKYLVLAAGVALLAFVIVNPFAILDHSKFLYDVRRQSDQSSSIAKLGTDDTNGWFYYAWTLFWGFGALPLLMSIAGAGLALKNDWRKSLPFVVFGLIVFLFMGKQLRFYARWMMPIYPVLAIFAAYFAVEAGRWINSKLKPRTGERSPAYAITAVMIIALLGPVIHVVHNDQVLSRTDTRQLAKDWIIENVPTDQKIAFDLLGPPPYYNVNGALKGDPAFTIRPLPRGSEVELYAKKLNPALLDEFEQQGYCYVVSGSTQKGRVTKDPSKAPGAAAYFKALDERGEKIASFSPMKPGHALPKFNFDISYNYYPLGYYRPGPEINIYRLSGGNCSPDGKT
ncbi:MAG: glycosyltransferase family 39 protein [Thermoleophilaceae bacterium]|nr:glycosyltransferase family 39 protein [Thermoleophilaceae bacterium]